MTALDVTLAPAPLVCSARMTSTDSVYIYVKAVRARYMYVCTCDDCIRGVCVVLTDRSHHTDSASGIAEKLQTLQACQGLHVVCTHVRCPLLEDTG